MRATNRYRARCVDTTLRRYKPDLETRDCLIDFVTDARHWCDRNGESYAELDRIAYAHYSAEVVAARKGAV